MVKDFMEEVAIAFWPEDLEQQNITLCLLADNLFTENYTFAVFEYILAAKRGQEKQPESVPCEIYRRSIVKHDKFLLLQQKKNLWHVLQCRECQGWHLSNNNFTLQNIDARLECRIDEDKVYIRHEKEISFWQKRKEVEVTRGLMLPDDKDGIYDLVRECEWFLESIKDHHFKIKSRDLDDLILRGKLLNEEWIIIEFDTIAFVSKVSMGVRFIWDMRCVGEAKILS